MVRKSCITKISHKKKYYNFVSDYLHIIYLFREKTTTPLCLLYNGQLILIQFRADNSIDHFSDNSSDELLGCYLNN